MFTCSWSVRLALILATIVAGSNPQIALSDGTIVEGTIDGEVAKFRGIPFATPPVGPLRWSPPQPWVNPNKGQVLDATRYGSMCTQYLWGHDDIGDLQGGSEDCLFLNVYVKLSADKTPSSVTDPQPVALWNHGGSYIEGSASLFLYNGVEAVDYWSKNGKDGVILVTTNYRLGIFGFLGSEDLRPQDQEAGSTGNYGMQDQRMAMQWVQENIGAFGGDAGRVTIFGESAGAWSMSNHLAMKRSWPFFQAVVLESGAFSELATFPMAQAQAVFDDVVLESGCTTAESVACLLDKSTHDILRLSKKNAFGYAAVADGVELTTHPWVAVAEGAIADVPVMQGSNSDEGAIFTFLPHDSLTEQGLTVYWASKGFSAVEIAELKAIYLSPEAVASYPDWHDATVYWWAAERAFGDEIMSCPAKHASQQISLSQKAQTRTSSAFLYYNDHTPRTANVTRHVSEIPYVFHLAEYTRHPADREMADIVSSYWYEFFTHHSPNVNVAPVETVAETETEAEMIPLLAPWTPYSTAADNLMHLTDPGQVNMGNNIKRGACDFFIRRIDSSIRTKFV